MRKNDAFVAKIVITRLTKGFMAMFAPAESLPSPATLVGGEVEGRFPNIHPIWRIRPSLILVEKSARFEV